MKKYFTEEYEDYSYEFIKDNIYPNENLVTCIFAFVKFENKIYLTKNHRWWELPWWHIEKWESYNDALARELAEEIGTTIKTKTLFWYKKIINIKKVKNKDWNYYPFPNSYILFYICEWSWKKCKINCVDTIDYWLFSIKDAKEKMNFVWNRKIIWIIDDFLQND